MQNCKRRVHLLSCLAFMATWNLASAQTPYEKHGHPCVAELCIGDGLKQLQGIPWEAINFKKSRIDITNKSTLAMYRGHYEKEMRGRISDQAVANLATQSFDSTTLPSLPAIAADCSGNNGLGGAYVTKSGNITRVGISLMSRDGEPDPQWTVTSISRFITVSEAQRAEAISQLEERYKRFVLPSASVYSATEKSVISISDSSSGADATVRFDLQLSMPYLDSLKKLPAYSLCKRAINLD